MAIILHEHSAVADPLPRTQSGPSPLAADQDASGKLPLSAPIQPFGLHLLIDAEERGEPV
jgi:hypothetical protein